MRALLAALLIICAGPALALSCMRPDVASSFVRAQESDKTYVVVHGRLNFDEARIPERDMSQQGQPDVSIPARLTGQSLSKAGFKTAFDRNVSLDLQCFGPWCGSATSGMEYLVFLEKTEASYVVPVDPCGSMVFAKPKPAKLEQAVSCMRGKSCKPAR